MKEVLKENNLLKERLEKYEHPKNSNNSSMSPSNDENRPKTKSLREKSIKKVGGQAGHRGTTIEMTDFPDSIVEHKLIHCTKCGKELGQPFIFKGKRQVIDIPPIKTFTTEHRIYSCVCTCGKVNCPNYPKEASNNVSYGANIETLINYMSVRQYMPTNRIKEFFEQVCKLPISEGTICNKLSRFAEKLRPEYNNILEKIKQSKCVGVDETGCKINGLKYWAWIWQTIELSYIAVSDNRGYKTIERIIGDSLKNCILVHDCWKAQFMTLTKFHQICLAHILRELNYFIEMEKENWTTNFKNILQSAIRLKNNIDYTKKENYQAWISRIKNQASRILEKPPKCNNKEIQTFYKRMKKYQDYLFVFLDYQEVPYDNNGSERGIRNFKVKLKVSTQFKTLTGAQSFAISRSIIDTAIKSKQNIFEYFHALAV